MRYNPPVNSTNPDASYVDGTRTVKGSIVPARAIEDPQREIVNVITAAGMSPSADYRNQLTKAIKSLSIHYDSTIDYNGPVIVLASDNILYLWNKRSGPSSTVMDPINDRDYQYWIPMYMATNGAVGIQSSLIMLQASVQELNNNLYSLLHQDEVDYPERTVLCYDQTWREFEDIPFPIYAPKILPAPPDENLTEWVIQIRIDSNNETTGIPITLYGQDNVTLTIDWGDGDTSTLTSADFTDSDSTASTHTYQNYGNYTVTISCDNWEDVYLATYSDDTDSSNACVYYWRNSVVGCGVIPQVKGTYNLSNSSTNDNSFDYLFYDCGILHSVSKDIFSYNYDVTSFVSCFGNSGIFMMPEDLFIYNESAENFTSCFQNCGNLTSIPINIFANNSSITNLSNCFSNIPVQNIVLRLSSQDISGSNANTGGSIVLIYVPEDSTTYDSYYALSSSTNIIVVPYDSSIYPYVASTNTLPALSGNTGGYGGAYILPQATSYTLGGVIVDDQINSTSANPVENRAVKSGLDAKVSITDTLTQSEIDTIFRGDI